MRFGRRSAGFASAALIIAAVTAMASTSGASGTGSISGTVTNAQTSAAMAGVCIAAYGDSAPYIFRTTTAASGSYTIAGLANGSYAVQVDPTCNLETPSSLEILWLPTVTVASGSAVTGANASLVEGGIATGTVVGSQTSQGIFQVCVDFVSTTNPSNQIEYLTTANGSFTVANLEPGAYNVTIEPNCPGFNNSSVYATQMWPQPVTVTSGTTVSNLNVTLEVGASISGTVTVSATKSPVTGAVITLEPTSGVDKGRGVAYGVTAADGTYTITGLAAGTYDVDYFGAINAGADGVGPTGPYAGEATTNPLTVAAGSTSTNVNFALFNKTVSVAFTAKSYVLNNVQKRALLAEARTIASHSLVVVTGYALHNAGLAKKRAEAAAAYMKSKEGVVSNVKTMTNVALNQVVIVNDGFSRDPAS